MAKSIKNKCGANFYSHSSPLSPKITSKNMSKQPYSIDYDDSYIDTQQQVYYRHPLKSHNIQNTCNQIEKLTIKEHEFQEEEDVEADSYYDKYQESKMYLRSHESSLAMEPYLYFYMDGKLVPNTSSLFQAYCRTHPDQFPPVYICTICSLNIGLRGAWEQHILSNKHKKKVELAQLIKQGS